MTKFVVRVKSGEKESVQAQIEWLDPSARFDAEGNPVTFWVTTVIDPRTLSKIDGVTFVAESCEQPGGTHEAGHVSPA